MIASLQKFGNSLLQQFLDYSPTLLLALLTLLIGLWLIRLIIRSLDRLLQQKEVDETLRPFLNKLTNVLLKVLLFISIAAMVGIETTSFIAIIGAAGLAVGLALQGSLSNFASGVLLLTLRPFEVGDFITVNGYSGTVQEIQVFYTILKTPQNDRITLPNSAVSSNTVTNYTAEPVKRLDLRVGIGYDDDIDQARKVIQSVLDNESRIHKEPAPAILVETLGDNSVNFVIRVWTDTAEVWNLKFTLTEAVKKALDEADINIPYPQRDIHIKEQAAPAQ